jgi:hypothetical protein
MNLVKRRSSRSMMAGQWTIATPKGCAYENVADSSVLVVVGGVQR